MIQEGFTDGILTLHLTQHPVQGAEAGQDFTALEEDSFAKFAQERDNMSDFGLSFFFDVMKELVINVDFINILYRVIAKIIKTHAKEFLPVPEMHGPDADGNEPSEEEKTAVHKKIEDATRAN